MRYLILLITVSLLSGCSRCSLGLPEWVKYPGWDTSYFKFPWTEEEYITEEAIVHGVDEQEATKVMMFFANEMFHKKHLKLQDSKVFIKDGSISRFRLEFISQDLLTLCEARELLVDVTEGIKDRVVNDEFLAGYLPIGFDASNIEIFINLESYWGLYGDPMYIGWIILQEGMSYFYAFDLKDHHFQFTCWHSHVEPFYKSHQIVTFQREAEKQYRSTIAPSKEDKLKELRYGAPPPPPASVSIGL